RRGQQILRGAHIRLPDRANLAIRPGQLRCPFDGVVPIVRFVDQWVVMQVTLRSEPAAGVLYHKDIATGNETLSVASDVVEFTGEALRYVCKACLIVGCPHEQDRETAWSIWPIDIRVQRNAIAHFGWDMALLHDFVHSRN